MINRFMFLMLMSLSIPMAISSDAVDQLLSDYGQTTTEPFSAERGQAFWQTKGAGNLSCAGCHGQDVTNPGKHSRTGKVIAPMARSVNASRLTDVRTIEKWLFRNCKTVWSRECTVQEKGDVLVWLQQQ
ncbi:DUF1924 domain-containing protein [Reinekea blandensis]|uniref:Mono-heme class I cytochrome c n=1 Tax=Reinekea blandensis MED297 TaxID=314283 RepID=A4BGK6_9GAMM|nr:DUF1924 domain-containing protein [Reinekea blandensis]EAR08812.1 Mono-heme class I cytochrome c [Reinekea sp. MED297] [Reinekea blandensis MED297]